MEKSNRPQRNRRHSRRAWPPEDDIYHTNQQQKRLFTPEIKRMLKEWLVRRRENPYPSREEKKRMAYETGLTYTQICNWFANWRRKLKNSERERQQKSWGHLIKNYNTKAKGNVEQFSISSEDSIWEEEYELHTSEEDDDEAMSKETNSEHSECIHYQLKRDDALTVFTPAYQIESANDGAGDSINMINNSKYKHKMMQKYLKDAHFEENRNLESINKELTNTNTHASDDTQLTKWLESAVKFTPNKNNYYIELSKEKSNMSWCTLHRDDCSIETNIYASQHQKDELDAAEALANLAFNCRQKMLHAQSNLHSTLKPISS